MYDKNGKFVFDGEFFEGMKFGTHVSSALFLEYHEHMRRIRASTRMDNTHGEQFLNNFLNFIFLGKGMTIGTNIGRKAIRDKGNEMIMNTMGRGKSLGSIKNNSMFGEDGLEVMWHRGCLSGMNGRASEIQCMQNFLFID